MPVLSYMFSLGLVLTLGFMFSIEMLPLIISQTRFVTSIKIQAGKSDLSTEQMQKRARLFEDIEVTPQVHRAVFLEQSAWHAEAALIEGRKALDEKLPDTDQFYTWLCLVQSAVTLLERDGLPMRKTLGVRRYRRKRWNMQSLLRTTQRRRLPYTLITAQRPHYQSTFNGTSNKHTSTS
jgi:hypothetical protein